MVRLATVGTSTITELFLNACTVTGRYMFFACYSRSSEKARDFAQKFGFSKTYTDLAQMACDPEVDAVYIASPNSLHYSQSKLFLEYGKHVICEKPIAMCAEEYAEPLDVKASAAYLPNGADIAGSAILAYPGFLATLSYSKAGQGIAGTEIIGDQGVVIVGSISQYGEISIVKDGIETVLLKMPTRNETMSGEANHFADYVENPFHPDYQKVSALTVQVHGCMDRIKKSAGIQYR